MAYSIATNYKAVLRDIFDSEELKIDSEYSKSLKKSIQEICEGEDAEFERCFLDVQQAVANLKTDKEEYCFDKMYLYLAEELPKAIEKSSTEHRDPILWQVRRGLIS